MSRLRRLVLSDRSFFITCRLLAFWGRVQEPEFGCLSRVLRWLQSERDSPCPLYLLRSNTEGTERLSVLRVEAFLPTEDTEGPLTRGEILVSATTSARTDLRGKNSCSADL